VAVASDHTVGGAATTRGGTDDVQSGDAPMPYVRTIHAARVVRMSL